ncbi:MAG TPA: antA/AntB antirepressor family protein [Firmicutes bacterium]|nr:antA/AntB antirepressor family protein [Bacillales bacterium]HJA41425.1 antA/AntB antirepressor family protein [Bacillota bacterium]
MSQKRETAQGNTTTFVDHHLKIDMAKEISMIQRTDRGIIGLLNFEPSDSLASENFYPCQGCISNAAFFDLSRCKYEHS